MLNISFKEKGIGPVNGIDRNPAHKNRRTSVTQIQRQFLLATGRRVSSQTIGNRFHADDLHARRPLMCVPQTARRRVARGNSSYSVLWRTFLKRMEEPACSTDRNTNGNVWGHTRTSRCYKTKSSFYCANLGHFVKSGTVLPKVSSTILSHPS
ncbi:hypothetical protein TNCV_3965161 [Trichonephila clavipes]|nr:hypothetical protein TNCV_3965161 [Trichonephila clavipes]